MFSHFSSAWAKTLTSASLVSTTFALSLFRRCSRTQTVRLAPVALGVVISFASDASYSLNDVRETLPGYLALLLHILSTGASEHFRSILVLNVGPKYLSICCTVGAAAFSLIVYTAREILVGPSQSLSACSQPHARYGLFRQACHRLQSSRSSLFVPFLWPRILFNMDAAPSGPLLLLLHSTVYCLPPPHSLRQSLLD